MIKYNNSIYIQLLVFCEKTFFHYQLSIINYQLNQSKALTNEGYNNITKEV